MAELRKSLLKVFRNYEKFLWDIVIFGSYTKDKDKPNDIDVAAVLKDGNLEIVEKISSEIDKITDKIHYSWIFLKEIDKNPLWMTLMVEGFSVKSGKKISDMFGYRAGVIFSYSLAKLDNKSKFSHALFGRNGSEGKINEVSGEAIARGVVFVPIEKSDSFRDFLNYWKVDYRIHKVIVV